MTPAGGDGSRSQAPGADADNGKPDATTRKVHQVPGGQQQQQQVLQVLLEMQAQMRALASEVQQLRHEVTSAQTGGKRGQRRERRAQRRRAELISAYPSSGEEAENDVPLHELDSLSDVQVEDCLYEQVLPARRRQPWAPRVQVPEHRSAAPQTPLPPPHAARPSAPAAPPQQRSSPAAGASGYGWVRMRMPEAVPAQAVGGPVAEARVAPAPAGSGASVRPEAATAQDTSNTLSDASAMLNDKSPSRLQHHPSGYGRTESSKRGPQMDAASRATSNDRSPPKKPGKCEAAGVETKRSRSVLISTAARESLLQLFVRPIHPCNSWKVRWDMLVVVAIIYMAFSLPYKLAFQIQPKYAEGTMSWLTLGQDVLFAIDMFLGFRTGVASPAGDVIMEPAYIIKAYMRTWLLPDILSLMPWSLISSELNLLKVMRLARMVRLVKLTQMVHSITNGHGSLMSANKFVPKPVLAISTFILSVMLLIHISGCAFHWVSYDAIENGETGWLSSLLDDDNNTGKRWFDHNNGFRYLQALYWAMTTMTTIGYGDIVPVNLKEKGTAMVSMFVGVSVFAILNGSLTTIITELRGNAASINKRKQAINEFLLVRNVPEELASKVREFYGYVLSKQVFAEEKEIIAGLSNPLQTDMMLHLHGPTLEKVPFFHDQHPQFLSQIAARLKLEVYGPGDVVIFQGDNGDNMFFISRGLLSVRIYEEDKDRTDTCSMLEDEAVAGNQTRKRSSFYKHLRWFANMQSAGKGGPSFWATRIKKASTCMPSHYRHIRYIGTGEFFGEYGCLTGEPRMATIVATDYCEVHSLTSSDLNSVLEHWPEVANEFALLQQQLALRYFNTDQKKILERKMQGLKVKDSAELNADPSLTAGDGQHTSAAPKRPSRPTPSTSNPNTHPLPSAVPHKVLPGSLARPMKKLPLGSPGRPPPQKPTMADLAAARRLQMQLDETETEDESETGDEAIDKHRRMQKILMYSYKMRTQRTGPAQKWRMLYPAAKWIQLREKLKGNGGAS